MAKNKIIYNGNTLIDLTGDTVTADKLMQGYTAHDRSGAIITGTATGGGTGAISVVDTEDTHGGTIRTITAVDISDTTATASDVASGKYFYTNAGVKTEGTSSGGGGGGATNIVQGEFTTGSTEGTKETINIPYNGNGYPVSLVLVVKNGMYNNTSAGDTNWYNAIKAYAMGCVSIVKCEFNTQPDYAENESNNQGTICCTGKSTNSSATSYSRYGLHNANVYTSGGAVGSVSQNVVFKSDKSISYYIANGSTSGRGLLANTTYSYCVIYSE